MEKGEPRHRFTKREIKKHLMSCSESNMTVADYCKENNLVRQTFYSWRLRFSETKKSKPTEKKFIPLSIKESDETSETFAEVCFPDGKIVRFFHQIEASQIRLLLK